MGIMRRPLLSAALALLVLAGAACQDPAPPPTPSPPPTPTIEPTPTVQPTPTLPPLTAQQRTAIFERVWTLVNDNFAYPDFNGVDWDGVRETYTPLVAADQSAAEFYGLVWEMVNQLGSPGTYFRLPQQVAMDRAAAEQAGNYTGIGMLFASAPAGLRVLRTVAGGPAQKAGLRPGDMIVAVDGQSLADLEALGPQGAPGLVLGPEGTEVTLTVETLAGSRQEIPIVRRQIDFADIVWVEGERLPETSIAWLTLHTFGADGFEREVEAVLNDILAGDPVTGLIIDLRTNLGGSVDTMRRTAGFFHAGDTIGRTDQPVIIPANRTLPPLDEVPLVVLIGPDTSGVAEIFAAGLQHLGRATIVGLPSGGFTEVGTEYDLPLGSQLVVVQSVYELPDGALIEGVGVQPDRRVEADWTLFRTPEDPQIQAALAALP